MKGLKRFHCTLPLHSKCIIYVPVTVSLFRSRMSEWGMNTYLYAPKDDDKHRASWRDLYSLEEAEQLSHLLLQASSRGIIFIYAIAPGLDMTFSSSQEISLLKRKLDQVRPC